MIRSLTTGRSADTPAICSLILPAESGNDFVHTTNELVTVVVGKLRLTIGDEEIVARPGDEVFIPKNVRHSVKNISSSTTQWLYG
ncbi:MAG: hypothetical protein Nkreftii_001295 [Candidatus Nitrospira kreftii]|uniref:Cupin type-2 domain-containing protein n=1 Tax=Candidatus Nitrospira kreftii TaxID=2652173 RepID=A0A7S8FCX9_9BACT|nr:MAG: hypothetical protein Nkreftii_001295 [Candidatus Nitrospira kreftii]